MKKLIIIIFCLLFSIVIKAEEKITDYDVQLLLNNDASAIVTENITVIAEHKQIRRGIYRDLPKKTNNPITVISLNMDNSPHPYFTENINNKLRVNFGNDDFIQTGSHTYSFTYQIKNIVNFFKEYDEIYWNVTGNNWSFIIDKAKFTLILPEGAKVIEDKISLYTGKYGSKESNAKQLGKLSFETIQPLSIKEGFTVAVPFHKGIIKEPDFFEKYLNTVNIIIICLVIFFLIYYLIIWNHIGRDPEAKVVRQYAPPKGISPAFAKYISEMNSDSCLVIVFISLAVKGIIKITEETGNFLQKTSYNMTFQNEPAENQLSEEELFVYRKLFMSKQTIKLSGYNEKIEETNKELKGNLKIQEQGMYFQKNALWHIPVIITIFAILFYLFSVKDVQTVFMTFFPVVFFIPLCFFISGKNITKIKIFIRIILIGFLVFIALKMRIYLSQNIVLFCGVIVLCIISAIFSRLLPAYTKKGRELMDEIDGFKQYLSIAEEGRTFLSDPTNAEQIFCDYLPYAIALGVENKWTNYFESILGKTMVEQSMHSRGIIMHRGMISGYTSGFSSALISASVKPGRGSSGGGFSGGGFGGGGGGGR